jgi:hypothetical protein
MMTLRKGLPAWAWLLGATALLYLALWGGTFILAFRHVRELLPLEDSRHCPSEVWLNFFDPVTLPSQLPPDDKHLYAFAGNVSCPCPLMASYDVASFNRSGGTAIRVREFWRGRDWKQIGIRTYWSY